MTARPAGTTKRRLTAQRALNVATDEPISEGVAARYASALFELATEVGNVAGVEADLSKFDALLDESEDLRRLIASPVFSIEDQARGLSAVLAKAEISGLAANFFNLVTKNRRLFVLPQIIKAFRAIAARARGEVTAVVTSAVPLKDDQVAALKESLKAAVGKEVNLTAKVDPSLIGGLIVKLGSRMIDSSLKTKLAGLKNALGGSA